MRCSPTSTLLSVLSLLTLMATSVDAASRNRSSRNTPSTNTSSGYTKTGSGSLVLSNNNNTYTGTTTIGTGVVSVTGGTLTLGSSFLSSSGSTVITSVGSVASVLTMAPTSTVTATSTATGGSPASMTLHNPQFTPGSSSLLQPGSRQAPVPAATLPSGLSIIDVLLLNYNGTNSFQSMGGTSTVPDQYSFELPPLNTGSNGMWYDSGTPGQIFIVVGGGITVTDLSSATLTSSPQGPPVILNAANQDSWSTSRPAGSPRFSIGAVPEPSMSLLCLGGVFAATLRRRRR